MKILFLCYKKLHVSALSSLVPYFNLKSQRISYYSLFLDFGVLKPSFGLDVLRGDEIDLLGFPYHIGSSSSGFPGVSLHLLLFWRFVAQKAISSWGLAF